MAVGCRNWRPVVLWSCTLFCLLLSIKIWLFDIIVLSLPSSGVLIPSRNKEALQDILLRIFPKKWLGPIETISPLDKAINQNVYIINSLEPKQRVLYVTAFINTKRNEWNSKYKRSFGKYFSLFRPYLYMDIDMVLFLDEAFLEDFQRSLMECDYILKDIVPLKTKGAFNNSNTSSINTGNRIATKKRFQSTPRLMLNLKVITVDQNFLSDNMESYKYVSKEALIMSSPNYTQLIPPSLRMTPEHSVPLYNAIMHMKVDFLKYVISTSTANKVLAWVDFGYFQEIESLPNAPLNETMLDDGKVHYTLVGNLDVEKHSDPVKNLIENPGVVAGAFFGGNRGALLSYQSLYHQILNTYFYDRGITDDDQSVALICAIKQPNLVATTFVNHWHKGLIHFQLWGPQTSL